MCAMDRFIDWPEQMKIVYASGFDHMVETPSFSYSL